MSLPVCGGQCYEAIRTVKSLVFGIPERLSMGLLCEESCSAYAAYLRLKPRLSQLSGKFLMPVNCLDSQNRGFSGVSKTWGMRIVGVSDS